MNAPKTDHIVTAAKELAGACGETASCMKGVAEGAAQVNQLYDHGYGGAGKSLISLGIALIMFPEPTMVSDVIGCGVVASGMLYNKVVPPPIYIDDVFKSIEDQLKSLHGFEMDIPRNYTVPVDFSEAHFTVD